METVEVTTKTKWTIDHAHSEIAFKVKHLMFSNVRGRFKEFEAHVYLSGGDFSSAEVDVRINPASIDTGTEPRDNHLRSADFLDIEKFREISFISTRLVSSQKPRNFDLYGELNIKGISRPVKLNVEFGAFIKDPQGVEKVLFGVTGKISRQDWGLIYNPILETGGAVVGDEVVIQCEVQLVKQV